MANSRRPYDEGHEVGLRGGSDIHCRYRNLPLTKENAAKLHEWHDGWLAGYQEYMHRRFAPLEHR
jgi:hypothetical protein